MTTRSSSVIHGVGGATGSPASRRLVRSTSSATSPAFHEPQADGPVARLSASTRAASRSSVERSPTSLATRSAVAGSSRSRRVARVGQEQVEPDHGDQGVHVLGREVPSGCRSRATTVMPTSVWSPGNPLPMSWRRVPSSRRSARSDPVGQRGGDGRRLEEVPVDGEAVVGVALGLVPHRGPLGQVPLEQVPLVQRLEGGDGRGAGGQHPHQRGPQVVGPGLGRGRRLAAEEVEGVPGDGQILLGGHRGQSEGQGRVARRHRRPRSGPPRPRSRRCPESPGTG